MRDSKHGLNRAEYQVRAHEYACRGRELPQSKLNDDIVRIIRENKDGLTASQWAEYLGVHRRTIDGVRSYRTWRHVR